MRQLRSSLAVAALAIAAFLLVPLSASAFVGPNPITTDWDGVWDLVVTPDAEEGQSGSVSDEAQALLWQARLDAGTLPTAPTSGILSIIGTSDISVGWKIVRGSDTLWMHSTGDYGTNTTNQGQWGSRYVADKPLDWVWRNSGDVVNESTWTAPYSGFYLRYSECSARYSGCTPVNSYSALGVDSSGACGGGLAGVAYENLTSSLTQNGFSAWSIISASNPTRCYAYMNAAQAISQATIDAIEPWIGQTTAVYTTGFSVPADPGAGTGAADDTRSTLLSGDPGTDFEIGQLVDGDWEGIDTEALLSDYVPQLNYHADEMYSADKADIATDLFLQDPDPHGSKLQRITYPPVGPPDDYTVAEADPSTQLDPLSLGYLGTDAEPGDFLMQPDIYSNAVLSAATDYFEWVVSDHTELQNFTYGRVVVDPDTDITYLQYWFYYYFNPKEAEFYPFDLGEHQADWEWVQIRLSEDLTTPEAVSASQHGDGEQCDWGPDVDLYDTSHPIIYVAHESHANYFWHGTHHVGTEFDDYTDGEEGAENVPTVIDISTDPPAWIEWDGRWGSSGGIGTPSSPESPGQQSPWDDPSGWEDGNDACTSPPSPAKMEPVSASAGLANEMSSVAYGQSTAVAQSTRPALPEKLTARLVTGTRFGKAVRVTYCFSSMPTDPWTRPWRLHLTVDNVTDKKPPLSVPWKVKRRCGTVVQPVSSIKPKYVLRYFVESRHSTRSREVSRPFGQ